MGQKAKLYTEDSTLNAFVNTWVGRPYKYGGIKETGIDCSGFSQMLYCDVYNIGIPRSCTQQYKFTKRVKKKDLMVGDIVFFRSPRSPSKWHCGIYLGNNKFVNASSRKRGVVVSDLSQSFYKTHYRGAGRVIVSNIYRYNDTTQKIINGRIRERGVVYGVFRKEAQGSNKDSSGRKEERRAVNADLPAFFSETSLLQKSDSGKNGSGNFKIGVQEIDTTIVQSRRKFEIDSVGISKTIRKNRVHWRINNKK